ncbi:zinc finger MYM-type protein 1-like [Ornithodoros turicata]|uniref:zinc finger MYM-type protein 1-like n=1 Tax=Ornithodoros turicata TaxID=34597 RepID=UPI00313984C7
MSLPSTSRDRDSYLSFVTNGFSNWKKALHRFQTHEASSHHKAATNALAAVKGGLNVVVSCSRAKQKEMRDARKALLAILSSVKYLACQGLAIRGHDDADSNLKQLLELRSNDVPELKSWLQRTTYKWISHDVVNEMLELLADDVLRSLTNEVRAAEYYSVIMDETTNISVKEQVSVCFRIVQKGLQVQELFCGFFCTTDTKAATLCAILNDILRRFNLPIGKCRGQCYDGAANMKGQRSGLQALIQQEEPRALYVHCIAHVINLVLQDMGQRVSVCRDFLSMITELIGFVSSSPKRLSSFQTYQEEDENVHLRKFCPTRWTLKAASLRSVLQN